MCARCNHSTHGRWSRVTSPRVLYAVVWLTVLGTPAFAEELRWEQTHTAAVQLNPLGASVLSQLRLSVPLWKERSGVLWDGTRVEAGLINQLTPAFDQLGVRLFVEPIAVFDVALVMAARLSYAGLGFPSRELASYDGVPDEGRKRDTHVGSVARIVPRLKAAYGPFAMINATALTWTAFPEEEFPQGYLYEPVADAVVRTRDLVVANSTTIVWRRSLGGAQLILGGEYLWQAVPNGGEPTQRVAALSALDAAIGNSTRLNAAVMVGVYPQHARFDGHPYAALQVGLVRVLGATRAEVPSAN